VAQIIEKARESQIQIKIVAASSFIEASVENVQLEVSEIRVVDALSLPDFQDRFRSWNAPFSLESPNLIYQVYDRDIASRVKLAMLECYPPDFEVLIAGATNTGASSIQRTEVAKLDWPAHSFDHLTSVIAPALPQHLRPSRFNSLVDVVARLRDPEKGCPWDVQQTPKSMRANLLEETCETLDAIESGDIDNTIEELGDLLLQIVFHAQMAREADEFTIDDVAAGITEKLIRRHPHVFGEVEVSSVKEVLTNWDAIKSKEKGHENRVSVLDGVARSLPALARAQKISKKAANAGFEWDSIDGVFEKLTEEVAEFREAIENGDKDRIGEELGDILFTVVNLARFERIDAEDSLQQMVNRFIARFAKIEEAAAHKGVDVTALSQPEMEELWQLAKKTVG
jgi:tetrapyrrole methylase family protein/MazG family protein